ncbi:Ku protein [Streptomyces sp. NPDC020379]|uniref:Ku protein n=1 Tax=Streptomyces sp. NPDC020379 TaxID=3365071 RepID=UPI00378B90C3
MPRALWRGATGFGPVSVPAPLVTAVEEHGLPLHQVHDADGGRIRQEPVCDVCGRTVPYAHVTRGAERDGRETVLTEADLDRPPLPSKKLVDVLAFVDADRL